MSNLIASLRDVARTLRATKRHGAERDEPEGARWIVVSHTLAEQLALDLERVADVLAQPPVECACAGQGSGQHDPHCPLSPEYSQK